MLLARLLVSPFGLLVGWIFLISPLRRPLVWFRMFGMSTEMSWVWFLMMLYLDVVSRSAVEDFWSIWRSNAEAGLFRAYSLAGGPTTAGSSASLGRGLLRVRSRRLGGRAAGGSASSWLYRVSHGDDVDEHCAQYFINSSLSPVLLFRRRLKLFADVLKGIRSEGFTQSVGCSVEVLGCCMSSWSVWCCFLTSSWDDWVPPDLHGFYKWVFDSLEVLNGFLKQVVVSGRDVGIRQWTRWLREDLSSKPYVWLRPDFVPPSSLSRCQGSSDWVISYFG